jgi:hypothetical protein
MVSDDGEHIVANREVWRPLREPERALVEQWLVGWNSATGDRAELAASALARASCACGNCATFDIAPLPLALRPDGPRPFDVSGLANDATGATVAGLLVFVGDAAVTFEVYPFDDAPLELAALTFTIPR